MRVLLQRLDERAITPAYARPGDAGVDLCALESFVLTHAGGRGLVRTGLAIALPEGTAGLVLPRSGLALRHGVTLLNTPGLIDAGYRGELQVLMVNTDSSEDYTVQAGDRIAQLVVVSFDPVDFEVTDTLPESARGEGGFGHSGR
jgi:dUTP pyrophosphatase